MKNKIIGIVFALLLCSCSTPMRNYLEEPPKTPPPADSITAKKSDTLSHDGKKKMFRNICLRLEPWSPAA